jgi:hypothetical protein
LRPFVANLATFIWLQFGAIPTFTRHRFEGVHVVAQPVGVGGFGGQGFVLTAQHVPEAFNREGQIHNPASLAGRVGHRRSKARFQYTIRQSLNSRPGVDKKGLALFWPRA